MTLEAVSGSLTQFQLAKTYSSGSASYVRPIYLPVVSTVLVAVDGEIDGIPAWSVTRPGGILEFESDPGGVVTAGFLFDIAVRFERSDTFEGLFRRPGVSGYSELTLVERPLCLEDFE